MKLLKTPFHGNSATARELPSLDTAATGTKMPINDLPLVAAMNAEQKVQAAKCLDQICLKCAICIDDCG